MMQQIASDYFVRCAFPTEGDEIRQVSFFSYINDEYRNDEGEIFEVVPFVKTTMHRPQVDTGKEKHQTCVRDAIRDLQAGKLTKVIVSRIRKVDRPTKELSSLFAALVTEYPRSFVYWLNHPEYGMWIGATPEVLLTGENHHYSTMSLAGTLPANGIYNWDEKLIREQALVTSFISDTLKVNGATACVQQGPQPLQAGPVVHLCTRFSFRFDGEVITLAEALHPTPAVCGLPRDAARNFILSHESHERRLYTGYLGVRGTDGSVKYYVNLRCMQIFDDHLELFAGGGITDASDPESEWLETERKTEVLLRVIQG